MGSKMKKYGVGVAIFKSPKANVWKFNSVENGKTLKLG